ncbi:RlpA-like double-psi beta-barrel domain-containing protein, partial [Patescibacteria group bacterium]
FAASPDFPKGSRVRVHNIENGNFVDVVINDYGPERDKFPDRAIDLDKVAFDQIASLYDGVINISLESLDILPDDFGNILGINELGAKTNPELDLKAGIIINENTEDVIWEKNSTTSLPLASLTKLVAIKTFLDTKPSLNREVAYSIQDEEYNYEYCEKWESARIKLNDGDVLTIEDLLYSSLVASANNTIETLVRVSGMARDDFIHKMNTTVQEWGAISTYFEEPTGLSPENVSSPADYAIISKRVLTHPIIQKASTMEEYKYYTINTKEYHQVRNTNHIIKTLKYNITGSKTGYLDEAGYCLMTRIKVNDHSNIIVVTFGAESRDSSFYETEMLIQYGIRKINKKI